ncbi:hexameric tyrosine-coordinated heme protein [Virgibacillus ainsalahensis]
MNNWLNSLKTDTPQEGFELAILLARKGVAYTQPSADVRKKLRPKYVRKLGIRQAFVANALVALMQ